MESRNLYPVLPWWYWEKHRVNRVPHVSCGLPAALSLKGNPSVMDGAPRGGSFLRGAIHCVFCRWPDLWGATGLALRRSGGILPGPMGRAPQRPGPCHTLWDFSWD